MFPPLPWTAHHCILTLLGRTNSIKVDRTANKESKSDYTQTGTCHAQTERFPNFLRKLLNSKTATRDSDLTSN